MLNRFLSGVCLLLACSTLIYSCKEKKQSPSSKKSNEPVVVDVIIAKPSKLNNVIEANGTVVANESVQLQPEISGRLTYLYVPEGKYITKGTVIARINDADLQAQLNKTKVLLQLAEKNEARLKKLLDINGVNQADYDAALNQVDSYNADIKYYEALIDKTVIKAPFNGLVGLRQISPGAYVTPTTIIASLQQTNQVKIDFTIPENYSNDIKIGNYVDALIDLGNKRKEKAVIIATEPQVNLTTRNLIVRAMLLNTKANPGAFAKIYINSGTDKNAIMIPSNAIIPDDKNNQVVTVKNGKANFVSITTGLTLADKVEITNGLNPGDSIVVSGVLFARPQSPLSVRNIIE